MTANNVLLVQFTDESAAYQGLSVLKQLDTSGAIGLRQASVVIRETDGRITVPEGTDRAGGTGFLPGSLIGMTLGILGGPVGVLLGFGAGGLVGGLIGDARRTDVGTSFIADASRFIAPGTTVLVADLFEPADAVVDARMAELGGRTFRRPTEQVLAEIEAAQDAAEAARKEADRVLKEQEKAQRRADREERKEKLSEEFEQRVTTVKDRLGVK